MDVKHEILQILQEECSEVIRAASKIIRFGESGVTPSGETNIAHLEEELGDLQAMIQLLHEYDMVSYTNIDEYAQKKIEKLHKYSTIFTL
jgi:NTP pyrophosphatase (non-canonical NTP hydrolase)